MIEIIAGIGAAAVGIIIFLWSSLRRRTEQRDEARRQVDTAEQIAEHGRRTQAASEKARQQTEQGTSEVRQTAREGRRNHFESDR